MRLSFLALCVLLLAGCASFESHVEPQADVSKIQRFWVERNLADNHAIGSKLVRALQARGREAELGPLTMMPREAPVILSFRDTWTWDFRDHLTALSVTLRDAKTKRLLARARFEGPLAMHLDEFEVIERVLDDLLKQTTPAAPPPAK